MMKNWIYFLILLVVVSCNTQQIDVTNVSGQEWETVTLEYAQGFKVFKKDTTTMIQLMDPDYPKILQEILIQPSGITIDKNKKIQGTGVVSFASSHTGALVLLDAIDKMKGVSLKKYVFNELIREKLDSGDLKTFGELSQINLEELIHNEVDLIFTSGRVSELKHHAILSKAQIGMLSVFEWREAHPLGRAEWIKFYGFLLGKENKANEVFLEAKEAYLKVKEEKSVSTKKTMMGNDYKGTWYMPGGNSFMAVLLKDVGAQYHWSEDSTTGSLPLSVEVVVENHLQDDIWINPGMARSLEELKLMNHQYESFNAFQKGEVYNFIKRVKEDGGNDFWETGIYQPHLILKDYQILFYDLDKSGLHYYEKLK